MDETFTLAHNAFSHLTWAEFSDRFHLEEMSEFASSQNRQGASRIHKAPAGFQPPTSIVDWEANGAVTPVKDQGDCGSCWAFSTTGALEGAYAIANNKSVADWPGLSTQQVVSCDTNDSGCNGGWPTSGFNWTMLNGGLCASQDFPYVSGDGIDAPCSGSSGCAIVSSSAPRAFAIVDQTDEALTSAVTQQPVSAGIMTSPLLMFYNAGVMTRRCGPAVNHGVLVVGYGNWTDGTPYWKVKNSFGKWWGMEGYLLLKKGENPHRIGGECGISLAASYPIM